MAKSILGALLFDRKPVVPELPEIDAQGAQTQAIAGNLKSLPQLKQLGSRVNRFLSEEISKAAERIMPGYSKLLQTGTEAIQSGVEGNLPEGVADNLRRFAAELGVGSGTVGSQFDDFRAVDLYGREVDKHFWNSISAADQWLSKARSATPTFDFTGMFISPAQQISVDQYNQQTQFQHQWLKNQLKAAPEGWEAAVQGLLDWVATTGLNIAGAYAGGGMGTGGQPGQSPGGGNSGWQSYISSNPMGSAQAQTANTAETVGPTFF